MAKQSGPKPVVTEQELDATDGVKLPREVRKDILLRSKMGETPKQIQSALKLKRHQVRSVLDPAYRNPHAKAKQLVTKAVEASGDGDKEKKLTFTQRALLNEANKGQGLDPNATANTCLDDLRKVAKDLFPKYLTRWDYYLHGQYNEVTWTYFFGTFEQFCAAGGVRPTRYQREVERAIAKQSSLDERRKFYREEIKPMMGMYPKATRLLKEDALVISASDFHDIEADPFALAVFLDTCLRYQPDVIALIGDVYDEYEFSLKYAQDPRLVDVHARRLHVKEKIFAALREACPDAQIDLILGNHEWRLLKYMADRTPNLKPLLDFMGLTIEDFFGVKEYEINLYCKWDFGAYLRKDVKDQLAQNYAVYYDALVATHFPDPQFRMGRSWVAGHTHRPEQVIRRTLDGRLTGTTMGSIAKTNALYVSGFDQAMNGFAVHHINPRKRSVISENILLPDDRAAVAGKYYYRE